jgi:hypothetical protein
LSALLVIAQGDANENILMPDSDSFHRSRLFSLESKGAPGWRTGIRRRGGTHEAADRHDGFFDGLIFGGATRRSQRDRFADVEERIKPTIFRPYHPLELDTSILTALIHFVFQAEVSLSRLRRSTIIRTYGGTG